MKPAVFFDRDGVINDVLWDGDKPIAPRKVDDFRFSDGVRDINNLKDMGFEMFVVTNQPDISNGIITMDTISKINNLIYKNLDIQEISVCPHTDEDECFCRKPKPGMIINLAQKWNIDLKSSFLVGDMWRDIYAGRNAGCTTILIDKIYNQFVDVADYRVDSISQSVSVIKELINIKKSKIP